MSPHVLLGSQGWRALIARILSRNAYLVPRAASRLQVKRRILTGCFVLCESAYHDYYELAIEVRLLEIALFPPNKRGWC